MRLDQIYEPGYYKIVKVCGIYAVNARKGKLTNVEHEAEKSVGIQ